MSDEYEFTVKTVPLLDSGLGIEAGFESDAALVAHVEAERAKQPVEVQEALRDWDRELDRSLLFGSR